MVSFHSNWRETIKLNTTQITECWYHPPLQRYGSAASLAISSSVVWGQTFATGVYCTYGDRSVSMAKDS